MGGANTLPPLGLRRCQVGEGDRARRDYDAVRSARAIKAIKAIKNNDAIASSLNVF